MSYLQCFIKDLPCCSAWHSASGEEGIPTNALVTTWQLAMPVLKSRSQVHRPSRSTPWRKVETWQGIFHSESATWQRRIITLKAPTWPSSRGECREERAEWLNLGPPGSLPTPTPTIATTHNQPLLSLEHCAQSALSSCLPNLPLTHQMCGRQP